MMEQLVRMARENPKIGKFLRSAAVLGPRIAGFNFDRWLSPTLHFSMAAEKAGLQVEEQPEIHDMFKIDLSDEKAKVTVFHGKNSDFVHVLAETHDGKEVAELPESTRARILQLLENIGEKLQASSY